LLRRIHRALGAVLVVPLVVWTATGLLFLVKPGWSGAYEPLSAFRDERLDLASLVPLSSLSACIAGASSVEVGSTALGPVYRIHRPELGARLVDAVSGEVLPPLDANAGALVAADAASRARAAERYGTILEARKDGDAIVVRFAGGAEVRVGRSDLALAQRGRDTALIDLLYRVHYLEWTGSPAVDRVLELAAIAGTWALAGIGIWLLRRPRAESGRAIG
jgi:hypothetical protein